jgi:hypothetical protein
LLVSYSHRADPEQASPATRNAQKEDYSADTHHLRRARRSGKLNFSGVADRKPIRFLVLPALSFFVFPAAFAQTQKPLTNLDILST